MAVVELESPVGRVWRRLRFQRFLEVLVWSLAVGLAMVAAILAAEKLTGRNLPVAAWLPLAVAVGLALAVAAMAALTGGPSRVDAAVAIDRAFHLNERLSTALCLPPELLESAVGRALLADAVRQIADIDVRPAFGPKLPRLAWLPLVPAALAAAVLFFASVWSQLPAQARPVERLEKVVVAEVLTPSKS